MQHPTGCAAKLLGFVRLGGLAVFGLQPGDFRLCPGNIPGKQQRFLFRQQLVLPALGLGGGGLGGGAVFVDALLPPGKLVGVNVLGVLQGNLPAQQLGFVHCQGVGENGIARLQRLPGLRQEFHENRALQIQRHVFGGQVLHVAFEGGLPGKDARNGLPGGKLRRGQDGGAEKRQYANQRQPPAQVFIRPHKPSLPPPDQR